MVIGEQLQLNLNHVNDNILELKSIVNGVLDNINNLAFKLPKLGNYFGLPGQFDF